VQYLNNLRLHEAAVLLKKSDKSVAQIAEAVGFDDVGYLSRRFKTKFGPTPIQVKNTDWEMKRHVNHNHQ